MYRLIMGWLRGRMPTKINDALPSSKGVSARRTALRRNKQDLSLSLTDAMEYTKAKKPGQFSIFSIFPIKKDSSTSYSVPRVTSSQNGSSICRGIGRWVAGRRQQNSQPYIDNGISSGHTSHSKSPIDRDDGYLYGSSASSRLFEWSSGHPYRTSRVHSTGTPGSNPDRMCDDIFRA